MMSKILKASIICCLVAFSSAFLHVYSPDELVKEFENRNGNRLPYSIANFGQIPYGKQMFGQVTVANPMTNCDYEEDIADENTGLKQNIFILSLRGDCTFVQKVKNSEQEGARMAVIMDNIVEKTESIIMANDGQGSSIKIPSIFIGEQEGDIIVKWIEKNPQKHVILSIKFETNITETADIGLWLDSLSRQSYRFVRDFSPYYNSLSDKVNIDLHYYTFSCSPSICAKTDCYSGYSYCQLKPDVAGTGRDVINQQLREYFVFQENQKKWWDYMTLIDEHCADYTSMKQCSDRQLVRLGISPDTINKRVVDSFDGDKNSILQRMRLDKAGSGIVFYPDVSINKIPYYGSLEAINVFDELCNSLENPPASCNSFVEDPDKIVPTPEQPNHYTGLIIGITISLVLFFLFMVCIYRRFIRRKLSRQMNDQVNQLVSHYISLYETKKIEEAGQQQQQA